MRDFIKDKNNIYYFSDGKLEKINLKIDINNLEYLDDGNFFGEKVKKGGYIENSRSTVGGRNTMAGKWEN